MLIGTAVVGATTHDLLSYPCYIKKSLGVDPEQILSILNPYTLFGMLAGGSVVYWFTGAATQAVSTGAYRAVEYIKQHIHLDENAEASASIETSKEVVKICTQYAQTGMFNIFVAIFSFALAFAFFSAPATLVDSMSPADKLIAARPVAFFISFLVSIAVFRFVPGSLYG